MTPLRVIDARYVRGYTLLLSFSDGSKGEVDLEHELDGEVFMPLKDISFFKQFSVDDELHTLTWPNGADFAPEFLHNRLMVLV